MISYSRDVTMNGDDAIVNVFYQMKAGGPLDIHWIQWLITDAKLYTGRPTMLTWKTEEGRRVQFFPNGTIQLMGKLTEEQAMALHDKVQTLLEMDISKPVIRNIVLCVKFSQRVTFTNIPSNKDINYNPELFPAAMVTRWHPAHISLFRSGSAIVTGVKSMAAARQIMAVFDAYMKTYA